MEYRSVIPTNAPKPGSPPDVRPLANHENERFYSSSGPKKSIQAASCLTEPSCPVIKGSFHNNGFLSVIHAAFDQHLPLLIVPDDIWHVFLSQISLVVNKDPERYRESFVDHKGKELIEVRNDSLIMDVVTGEMSKCWQTVFPIFEQKMNEKMKLPMNIEFSTTTKTHYTTSQILVMDTMKSYFNYKVSTRCGFPEIRIGGMMADWDLLDHQIQEVSRRVFNVPTDVPKSPTYSNFIGECKKVLEGKGDPNFWEQLYHFKGARGSGQTDTVTGIVNDLFPFDTECKRAPRSGSPRDVDSFPVVNGKVPFIWEYLGTTNECEFEAGLTHAAWDPVKGHLYCKPTWKISRKLKITDDRDV